MSLITKKTVELLANEHNFHCVSVFIPTHRSGKEVNEGEDMIKLKNALKEVRRELTEYRLSEREIKNYLKPAEKLVDDSGFWRHLSNGLAIFISKDRFEYFILPVQLEEFTYISDHFYLKPLMSLFNNHGRFFILVLSQDRVRFFECSPHSISEVLIENLVPRKLEDSVGYDYEEKFLQFRSDQVGGASDLNKAAAVFHGHGKVKDKKKDELLEFCRDVDKGLMNLLHEEDTPLLIASVDYLYPIYKEANNYKHLFGNFIPGNPEYIEQGLLHERALNLLADHFNKGRFKKLKLYRETVKRTSYDIEDIIIGALNGRVDTLFINNKANLWGKYDKVNNKIYLQDEKSVNNVCLLNLAAVETFLQKGKVYLMEPEEMPEKDTMMNAIFRY